MQDKLNIVYTIDENYVQHFTVACTSLLEHNRELIGRVCLVHDIGKSESLSKAIDFFKTNYNVYIEQYSLDSTVLEKFRVSHHVSKATYFRLLLAEILPGDIDKVLFLDSDIVVNGTLEQILALNFTDDNSVDSTGHEYYIFAADHKYSETDLKRLEAMEFKGDKYFNAGIMYINLKMWRSDNIAEILLNNAAKYNEQLLWWDQDVLNITFDRQWGELDYKYNAFGLNEKKDDDYKIIHYTGSSKPWHFKNKHPYRQLYWKYLKMTPYKRYIAEDFTVLKALKRIVPYTMKAKIKKWMKL